MRNSTQQRSTLTRRSFLTTYFQRSNASNKNTAANSCEAALPYVDSLGRTPNQYFYVPARHSVPPIDPAQWQLQVINNAGIQTSLSLDALRSMPMTELPATLVHFDSAPDQLLMGHAIWQGVRLLDLMQAFAPLSRFASFRSATGYHIHLPVDRLKDAVLAVVMNGSLLLPEQGFPLRLIVPGVYDYLQPKWLEQIVFTHDEPAFQSLAAYKPQDGVVKTYVSILSPRPRAVIGKQVLFEGIAYAGMRPIACIEMSIDGGQWMPVPFTIPPAGSWTRWQMGWSAPAFADYEVKVRAADADGLIAVHSLVFRVTA